MLKRVAFSGIDRWTNPQSLSALHKQYPFVEFAYLLSDSRKERARYPMPVILKAYKKLHLPMALHLCGKFAYDFAKTGDWQPVCSVLKDSVDLFDRVQINIPKISHFSRTLVFPQGKQIIIQLHEGTCDFFDCYRTHPAVQGFQDASGGRGILCGGWMPPETEFFGYAGGISPENVVETVRAINTICPGDYWIDMESSLRTNDRFDIEKCRLVCKRLVEAGMISI